MDDSTKRQPENRSGSGPLIRVDYEDDTGRKWAVWLPRDDADDPTMGIPLGPPDFSALDLPEETAIRLHNQLFSRGILTKQDLKSKHKEVFAAIQAAFKVDVARVTGLYD